MRIMDIDENTRFRPMDFDTDRYVSMSVFNRKDATPVLILMSRSSNPPHYMVIDGMNKQMFYLKYTDAMDYCRRMGYIPLPAEPGGRSKSLQL